jgi:translocator protein
MIKDIRLFVPALMGYGASALCSIGKGEGSQSKMTPKPWVFGVVWPILYILIGMAWIESKDKNKDLTFGLLSTILASWLIVYGCYKNKIAGAYIIAASVAVTVLSLHFTTKKGMYYLLPLLAWLLIAYTISIQSL